MRSLASALALLLLFASSAAAQAAPDAPAGGALDPESYDSLSADERAQLSLGGFRRYLERIEDRDPQLYSVLDPRLGALEERDTIADVVFWTGAALAAASLIAAIPVHEEVGLDPALGLAIGAAGVFLVAVIVQAIVRPGHRDLLALIDLHDEQLGRR